MTPWSWMKLPVSMKEFVMMMMCTVKFLSLGVSLKTVVSKSRAVILVTGHSLLKMTWLSKYLKMNTRII